MIKNIIGYLGYFGFALLLVSAAVGMWYDKPTDINKDMWGKRPELTREEKITEKALLFFYVGVLLVAVCGILVLLMHRG